MWPVMLRASNRSHVILAAAHQMLITHAVICVASWRIRLDPECRQACVRSVHGSSGRQGCGDNWRR